MTFFLENIFKSIDGDSSELIFGFIHVIVMLVVYHTGLRINRFLKIVSNDYIACIFSATLSYIFADLIVGYLDPYRWSMIGIVIGGLIPLIFIPLLGKFVGKGEYHIITRDQEDVTKRFRLLLKRELIWDNIYERN